MLTSPDFIKRLESLYLLARKVLNGSLQANRKTAKKGSGITFADYAEYNQGDDYRAIDWRVYARMDSLVIKLFELEEDAHVYVMVDLSRSMASKSLYARQLAAALGYIALASLDRLVVYGIADELKTIQAASHGRGKVLAMLRSLEAAECFGVDSSFNACMRSFQARHKRRGICIVISDFLFPDGFEDGMRFLRWNRHDVFCLQVQDDNDLKCAWKGDVELECVETGARRRVTVTPAEAARYETLVRDWNAGLAHCCARHEAGLVSTTPEIPFDDVVQNILRRGGLVG
jgi:uncharacterized protein (DUF58 family)